MSSSWRREDVEVTGPSHIDDDDELEELRMEAAQKEASRGRCRFLAILAVCAVIAIVVGTILGIGNSKKKEQKAELNIQAPTPATPTTPGPTPTGASVVLDAIMKNARQGGAEFEDPESYQSKALTWVLTQQVPSPNIDLSMEEQALTLYALACIWYNTNSVHNDWTDFHFGAEVTLPGWFSTRGWLEDAALYCSWYGITCNDESKVERIALDTNGLTGSLPAEIAYLADSLKFMDLYNNLIHNKGDEGNLFLGELYSLEYLYLGTTSFEYDGIPSALGRLTNLKELDVSYSLYFGEITAGMWSNLTELNYIVMDGNAYNSSFPEDFLLLPNLEYVYCGFSFLEGGLDWIVEMPKIYELWIDDNPGMSSTLPVNFTRADNLVSFSCTNCQIYGQIPSEMGEMSELLQVWLYDNKLTGTIPPELGNLRKLKILGLEKNLLTGEVPSELCARRDPWGRLDELETDCDTSITCQEDCCTCCGERCMDP